MRRAAVLTAALGLALLSPARSAVPPIAQAEINYLLEYVGNSHCEFYRNGTWYDSKQARAHLQSKFEILAARGQMKTAEEFIDRAATSSSLTGRPYQVRCGGAPIASNQWLHSELQRYRSHGAPREPQGVPASPRG